MINKSAVFLSVVFISLVFTLSAETKSPKRPYRCPKEPADETAAIRLASDLFDRGAELIDKRAYHRALKKFLCSAEIRDHVNTTFNIAQAARCFKNKRKVVKYFRYYIEKHPDTITAKELTKLIEHIDGDES